MSLDPKVFGTTGDAALSDRIAALERRVAEMGKRPPVAVGSGAPTSDLPDGWLYLNRSNGRFYARSGGAWKYVVLT